MYPQSISLRVEGAEDQYNDCVPEFPYHATEVAPGITDVVVPSNLIGNGVPGPFSLGPRQLENPHDIEKGPYFNAQKIAYSQRETMKSTLGRSASVSIAAINRSRAMGYDSRANEFVVSGSREVLRKTSLTARQEVGRRISRSTTVDRLDSLRHGRLMALPEDSRLTNFHGQTDYFRNFEFGAQPERVHAKNVTPDPMESPLDGLSVPMLGMGAPKVSIERANAEKLRLSMSEHTRKASVVQRVGSVVVGAAENTQNAIRRSSLYDLYEKAKVRGVQLQRNKWAMVTFQFSFYMIIVAFVYLVLVGLPLWNGAVYWLWWVFGHKFSVPGTWAVTIGVAALYAYTPLVIFFEKDPPMPSESHRPEQTPGVHNTALMIPCYKSAKIIGPTLEAATKIFPPAHIFVIANGNSPTPLDDTEEVCKRFGVNHVWSPIGSKIVAQFVGCYAAKGFRNVLLIDDDCALPPNFPIESGKITDRVKCIGYTIKSVGPNSSLGTLCQQAQDLEYKISGIQRALAGKIGSATFPHGAISLWDSEFLIQTFRQHPGFSVSEDWFFGHVARELGSRIQICTSVLIETETPGAVFFSSGGARGGFGEMTIFKQRFLRWNFFFVNGIWYNMAYILTSWKLGWWELGAKIFVFQEVYETLLYLLSPFVLPISFIVRPAFSGYLFVGTFGLYFVNVVIFNELHLRLKRERVPSRCAYLYYMPYKVVLTAINVGSCYWSLYKYATYFAKRHPRIIEDEKAVDVVLRLEEASETRIGTGGRRMTVTAVGSQLHGSVVDDLDPDPIRGEHKATITTLGSISDANMHSLAPLPENQLPEMTSIGRKYSTIVVGSRRISLESAEPGLRQEKGQSKARRSSLARSEHSSPDETRKEEYDRWHEPSSLQSLPEALARGFSNAPSRSSLSPASSTRRARRLMRPRHNNVADFDAVDFSELMDKLSAINERLNQ